MTAHFITSSGTGIGKTLVTAALAWQLRERGRAVRAIKPVISGFAPETAAESDTGIVLAALGEAVGSLNQPPPMGLVGYVARKGEHRTTVLLE